MRFLLELNPAKIKKSIYCASKWSNMWLSITAIPNSDFLKTDVGSLGYGSTVHD